MCLCPARGGSRRLQLCPGQLPAGWLNITLSTSVKGPVHFTALLHQPDRRLRSAGVSVRSTGVSQSRLGSVEVSWGRQSSAGVSVRSAGVSRGQLGSVEVSWGQSRSAGVSVRSTGVSWGQSGSAGVSRGQLGSVGVSWGQSRSAGVSVRSTGVSWGQSGSAGVVSRQLGSVGVSWGQSRSAGVSVRSTGVSRGQLGSVKVSWGLSEVSWGLSEVSDHGGLRERQRLAAARSYIVPRPRSPEPVVLSGPVRCHSARCKTSLRRLDNTTRRGIITRRHYH